MQLSIVIICWNDANVIGDCLRSIYNGTTTTQFEVIVSDNGSTDDSVQFIRRCFPQVQILENGANLGFAKGNNAGIQQASGEFVLILNPDTIVHPGALDKWIAFAEAHPECGAFGCRVHNRDGTYQVSARPFPTVRGYLVAALYLRWLAYISPAFVSDTYTGWNGNTEREVDWQSGCCLLVRGNLLRQLGGFDERFFYHFEEVDLCRRIWNSGAPIRFAPEVHITHLGGQSVGRFPVRFAIEKNRNQYRYFYKHFGEAGVRPCRLVSLLSLAIRRVGYGALRIVRPSDALARRLDMYRAIWDWTLRLDPVVFVTTGQEPAVFASDIAHAA